MIAENEPKQKKKLTSLILPPFSACIIEIDGDRSVLDENYSDKNQTISIEFLGGETISIVKLRRKYDA
jgi:hypothetical protein